MIKFLKQIVIYLKSLLQKKANYNNLKVVDAKQILTPKQSRQKLFAYAGYTRGFKYKKVPARAYLVETGNFYLCKINDGYFFKYIK